MGLRHGRQRGRGCCWAICERCTLASDATCAHGAGTGPGPPTSCGSIPPGLFVYPGCWNGQRGCCTGYGRCQIACARAFLTPDPSQVVVLGAGMDSRPWRMQLPPGVRWLELDLPGVVAAKRQQLEQLGVALGPGQASAGSDPQAAAAAAYPLQAASWAGLSADLSRPGWSDALRAAGLDPQQPTVWVAEGEQGTARARSRCGGSPAACRAKCAARLLRPHQRAHGAASCPSAAQDSRCDGAPLQHLAVCLPARWTGASACPPVHTCAYLCIPARLCIPVHTSGMHSAPLPATLVSATRDTSCSRQPPAPSFLAAIADFFRGQSPHAPPAGLLMYLEEDQVVALLREAAGEAARGFLHAKTKGVGAAWPGVQAAILS